MRNDPEGTREGSRRPVARQPRADLGIDAATAGLLTSLPVLCFGSPPLASALLAMLLGEHRRIGARPCEHVERLSPARVSRG